MTAIFDTLASPLLGIAGISSKMASLPSDRFYTHPLRLNLLAAYSPNLR